MAASEQGAGQTEGRWLAMPRTLAFLTHGDDVLLLKRAADRRVYPGYYNGVGGHLERDEDLLGGVRREVLEETGLDAPELELRAIYNIDAGGKSGVLLFVFTGEAESRALRGDGREGHLRWVPRADLGRLELVEDLPQMLPRILAMPPGTPPLFVHASYNHDDILQLRVAETPRQIPRR